MICNFMEVFEYNRIKSHEKRNNPITSSRVQNKEEPNMAYDVLVSFTTIDTLLGLYHHLNVA